MNVVFAIALILLCSTGYCTGIIIKAGKYSKPNPRIIDLVFLPVIWVAALYGLFAFEINKWLLLLACISGSLLIGILALWPGASGDGMKMPADVDKEPGNREKPKNLFKRFWQLWVAFFSRVGDLQTRIGLSLFFLVITAPVALAVKLLSDPLRIKHQKHGSYWIIHAKTEDDIDMAKRQF